MREKYFMRLRSGLRTYIIEGETEKETNRTTKTVESLVDYSISLRLFTCGLSFFFSVVFGEFQLFVLLLGVDSLNLIKPKEFD